MLRRMIRAWSVLLLPAAVLLLTACGDTDRDEAAPALTVNTEVQPPLSPRTAPSVPLSGTIERGATLEAFLNGVSVGDLAVTDTTWAGEVAGLQEGSNLIALTATDEAGNTNTIRVVIVLDTTGPVVLSPLDGAANLPRTALSIVFNEPLDPATVDPANLTVAGPDLLPVPGTLGYTAGTVTVVFTPAAEFAPETAYVATVGVGLADPLGNPAAGQTIGFTTAP